MNFQFSLSLRVVVAAAESRELRVWESFAAFLNREKAIQLPNVMISNGRRMDASRTTPINFFPSPSRNGKKEEKNCIFGARLCVEQEKGKVWSLLFTGISFSSSIIKRNGAKACLEAT